MLVPQARWLVPLGDLDPLEAAPLTDAGLTPYHAIKRSLHLLHGGSTAVVIGAGGLGHLAVQILKATSAATVVAVDTKPAALELATSMGADHAVVSDGSASDAIRDITRNQGADLVLDCVGVDATMALAAQISRSLGHVTVVGIGGGTFGFSFFSLPYEASLATTYWGTLPELTEVLDLSRRGLVRAHVHRFGLDEATDAYDALDAGDLGAAPSSFPSGSAQSRSGCSCPTRRTRRHSSTPNIRWARWSWGEKWWPASAMGTTCGRSTS
jgi:propanol-preferring alcohol dehydrogenase